MSMKEVEIVVRLNLTLQLGQMYVNKLVHTL